MRYLGAAVALMVAMTFSLTALGQTPRASKIGVKAGAAIGTGGGIARATEPVQPGTTVNGEIPRYTNTFIISYTEYNLDTCAEVSPGMWSTPPAINPAMSGTFSTQIGSGTLVSDDACNGMTYTFAEVWFNWTAHNNKTAMQGYDYCPLDPSPPCPVAVFSSTYSTPDGDFNLPYQFDISVSVVRPKDEVPTAAGWAPPPYDSNSQWTSTLQCCAPPGANGAGGDDDSTFSFIGEMVREVLVPVGGCEAQATLLTGETASPPNPGTWTVGQIYDDFQQSITPVAANIWGYDYNGVPACGVEIYRCLKVTPCSQVAQQTMQIQSPADSGWTTYTINSLALSVEGSILDNFRKIGIGSLTAQRNGVTQWRSFLSNINSCSGAYARVAAKLCGSPLAGVSAR